MTGAAELAGRRPDFIVIGAMKAGTTSLYHYLREHPAIFMPKVKELDFFTAESNWTRGVEWYESQFEPSGDACVVGEASTLYAKYPRYAGVPARMASIVPDVKLIYIVRNPLERIRSHYEHRVAIGAETEPIERALLHNPIYVDYSRYASQIDQYLEHFDIGQLRVLTAESLRSDRRSTMEGLYGFLDVDPHRLPESLDHEFYRTGDRRTYPPLVWSARRFLKRHVPRSKQAKELVDNVKLRRLRPAATVRGDAFEARQAIPEHVRGVIAEMLRDDVVRLRQFLGDDFDCWGLNSPKITRGGK